MGRAAFVVSLLALAGCCRASAATRAFTARELDAERRSQHDRAGAGFESGVVSPFVIVASGPRPREVRDEATETITWARGLLRAELFEREPGSIITVWVFPDLGSYASGTSAVLGITPDTPYGFYRPCSRELVVNSGLGWGTLVHELVHAYMDSDFPDAPVWLKEGLASLFEAPREVAGHLRGAVNWRLPELQQHLRSHDAPTFARMADAGHWTFSGKEGSLYYSMGRYLCFYLQERGLLVAFYRAFRADHANDTNGQSTLERISGLDPKALRTDWERFVLDLRYERPR